MLGDDYYFNPNFYGGVFVSGSFTTPSGLDLRVEADSSPDGDAVPLTPSDLPPLVDEAIRELEQAGVAAPGALSDVNIQIVDLPGNELGEAIGNTILLDADAAGFGWYIDPAPADDVEFQTGAPEVQERGICSPSSPTNAATY